jgi:large subunit ribosomal protein L21
MIAVIETGGKQYLVKSGDTLLVEKLPAEAGATIVFDTVLLTANDDGSNVQVGTPTVSGATVQATCVAQEHSSTLRVVKFKNKVRYRRVHGHRQRQTKVTIA